MGTSGIDSTRQERLLLLTLGGAPVGASLALAPDAATTAIVDRGIATGYFLLAGLLLYLDWRVRRRRRRARLALAMLVVGGHLVLLSWETTLPGAGPAMAGIAMLFGAAAVAVATRRSLPAWLRRRLSAALTMVAAGHAAALAVGPGARAELVSGALLVIAGALSTTTAYVLLRRSLEAQRERAERLESSLLELTEADHSVREALHELKSTVAGLARASELLSDADLPAHLSQRLQRSMIREIARLERRLWSQEGTAAATVDLDVTLETLLELHRARGRVFAWTPNGTSVLGRQDAIAEAVNILLDNAATHGDATTGRVDVGPDDADAGMVRIAVSDTGPGVPLELRQRIFEWGERGPGSAGQGIGLSLARRLVSEQGGSLTLSTREAGSSFVIRLPAARRPLEPRDVHLAQHAPS